MVSNIKSCKLYHNYLKSHLSMIIALVSIFAVFFYIGLRTPVLWDDWGRFDSSGNISKAWEFASEYYPTNGRILGNIISIYILGHRILYAFLCAGIFTVLSKLMSGMTGNKSISCLVVAALIIATPVTLLSEAYTWICGFGYYVFPLLAISIYLFIQKDIFRAYKKTTILSTILGLVLGLLTQMFIENASIMAAIIGLGIIVISYIKHKKISGMHIAFFAGTIIGLIIMFSSPGYASSITKLEVTSKESIKVIFNNIIGLANHYILVCIIPVALISLHQIWKIQTVTSVNKILRIFLSFVLSFCIVMLVLNRVSYVSIIPNKLVLFLNIILILTLQVTLILTNHKSNTLFVPLLFAISIIAVLSLALASYWGSRNYIFSYYFLIAICGSIVNIDFIKSTASLKTISFISLSVILIWGSILVFVYRDVARTEVARRNIIEHYNENPTGDVYIPKADFESFFHGINPYFKNNDDNFHVKAFKNYYKIPQDTKIHYK